MPNRGHRIGWTRSYVEPGLGSYGATDGSGGRNRHISWRSLSRCRQRGQRSAAGCGHVSRRALPLAGGPSGAATWWDLDLVPHSEAPDLVLITARDVTEYILARRDAEDTRAAIEPIDARLRLAQEAAGIGTWEWQAASDRQSWSPQQFRLHGLDPAVAVPPSFDDWVGDDPPGGSAAHSGCSRNRLQ